MQVQARDIIKSIALSRMTGLRDEKKKRVLDWVIGFTGTSLQLQPITTAHNQWLSKASLHSSLDYECLLFLLRLTWF
jgi:hypothetical protein